jgi:phospholipid/cholesterol/gamma-HCH transport system permease protein
MEDDRRRTRGEIAFARQSGALVIRLSGDWLLHGEYPPASAAEKQIEAQPIRNVTFDAGALGKWDSAIVTFLMRVLEVLRERSIEADVSGLPAGIRRLLRLVEAVPEKTDARAMESAKGWLTRVGEAAVGIARGTVTFLSFLGDLTVATGRLLTFTARYRRSELFVFIQECGIQALPIVTLISFLVGLILAFVGSVQLQRFGATIYVANLVGLGMAREMGAMMTAIIMAGRTGAAFAAQLGTMKVTEEVDALKTLGLRPMEFLVLPRVIALCLMMPLLCVYSDLVGIVGGAVVGTGMLGLSPEMYWRQTTYYVTLTDFATGVLKSAVFGVLIAVSGCLRGLQSGSSASSVGDAATSAVVTSIVLIVVAGGLFAVLFNILKI